MKSRTLIRKHGWIPVTVPPPQVDTESNYWRYADQKEVRRVYNTVVSWCEEFVGKENYSTVLQRGGQLHNAGRFLFKNPKHATMFRMRWLTTS